MSALVICGLRAPDREQRRLVEEVGEVGSGEPARRRRQLRRGRPSALSGLPRACTSRISRRASRCGSSIVIVRSKRPGRTSAGSRISGRLLAPATTTASPPLKPSSSIRIWLSVFSDSREPPSDRAAALRADRVDLVDEDDRRRHAARLGEQVAHAGRADADVALGQLAGGDPEERRVRLVRERADEHRLPAARRADDEVRRAARARPCARTPPARRGTPRSRAAPR